jgi:hypothetical protein
MRKHVNAFTASFSVHLAVAVTVIWFSAAALRHAPEVVVAKPAPPRTAAPLDEPKPMEAKTSPSEPTFDLPENLESFAIEMPNFSFDFSKVANRATSLFPFLTHDVLFQPIQAVAERAMERGLPNPYARTSSHGLPPLLMSDRAIQHMVDKTWSRRERWRLFEPLTKYAGRYSANEGAWPEILRRYREQNLLQPYVESHVRDPRLWVMLGISADHRDFYEFISTYVARHPSTKASTELLFMLDELAQGSRDTLLTLLDVNVDRDLYWTRRANLAAVRTLDGVQWYYRKWLAARGITSSDAVQLLYDNVRLRILSAIVNSTPNGYREDDARFLIGSIYWKNGRAEDAVHWWHEMQLERTQQYAGSSEAVLNVIRGVQWQAVDAARIKDILTAERRRWTDFWWKRVRQFGYTFETFGLTLYTARGRTTIR